MYFGSPVWPLQWGPPYDEPIKRLHALGFKGVELIGWNREALDEYYTPETIAHLKELIESLGMVVTNFNHTPEGTTNCDPEIREKSFDDLCRAIDVAAALGSPNMTMVSAFPFGKSHGDFVELRHVAEMQEWSYGYIGSDWDENYEQLVSVVRRVCAYAAEKGLRVLIEPHPYRWINSTQSMLRLIDHVGADNLGMNFDPSHLFPQGDMPEWSVHMLKGRLWHTHFSDNDTLTNVHWRPGQGKINWKAVMKALKDIGYDGAINFELEDVPGAMTPSSAVHGIKLHNGIEYEMILAKDYIKEICDEQNIDIE